MKPNKGGSNRILFFPSSRSAGGGGSSDLRAAHIASILKKFEWDCFVIPPNLDFRQRQRIIRILRPSYAFIQQGTHPLNSAELFRTLPYFFDIDDAYYLNVEYSEKFRHLCEGALGVIASSEKIVEWCSQYNNNVVKIWTGAPVPKKKDQFFLDISARPNIIVWPHHFMPSANNNERKIVREILTRVRRRIDFEFWCIGTNNTTELLEFREFCVSIGTSFKSWPFLSYSNLNKVLGHVSVGIDLIGPGNSYNQSKSFGKVLAYIRAGVPCVVSRQAEYPNFFKDGENGFMAESIDEWCAAIVELLECRELRHNIAKRAFKDFNEKLEITVAAMAVDKFLRSTIEKDRKVHQPAEH